MKIKEVIFMKGKFVNPETGKLVSGAAAQQMIISNNGGWEAHHEKFERFIKEDLTKKFLAETEAEHRRNAFRAL